MNVVVTGATSFLGTAMIRRLLREGSHVYAVIRPGTSNKKALAQVTEEQTAGRIDVIPAELSRLDELDKLIQEKCPLFFHFGWDGSGSDNRKNPDVQQKNAVFGLRALEGARKLGCRRFLFSGSQAEYGICHSLMSEDRECRPVSEYGKAKVSFYRQAAKKIAGWKKEKPEVPFELVHTRIFSVYGPGDHPYSLVETCLDTFLRGESMKLGACTQQWNFLYIEDLAEALFALAACETPVGYTGDPGEDGVYNLAADQDATMPLCAYVEEMRRICGGRGSCVYGALPPNAEGQANLIPDIEKIKRKTGWNPKISFEDGIRRILETEKKEKSGTIMEKQTCILCGQPLGKKERIAFEGMPSSAQDIPDAYQVDKDQGMTLRLHQCESCGLVQFDCEPVGYYRDVIRSGGYSTTMVNLRTSQYRHLIDTYHLEGKKFLEVGCGRGEFLKVLTGFSVEAYGVEHRRELVEIARSEGLNVTQGFTETADAILGNQGPYDVFLSFNFLEHQPEPGVMLDCIRNNLTENGMGLITVPSLEYILQYNGYYELLRDHIAYYTFDTLRRLLETHGFQVLEEELVNRDTLSVIVKAADACSSEASFGKPIAPFDTSGLAASYTDIRRQMEEVCSALSKEGKTLAIWGASHQGFTLAATTVLKSCARYIMDSAPFKQGKFAPASHLPIVSPDFYYSEPTDVILIVAPGYTEEIAASIRTRFGEHVRILTLRSDKVEDVS